MSSSIVVDTSVVIKLVLEEERSAHAVSLYDDAARNGALLVAPSLLLAEVGNAIYQRYRRGAFTLEESDEALARFARLRIEVAWDQELYQHAFAFARDHRLPAIYDSHFVVLARSLNAECWTDDQRLLNSIGQFVPWVRWIGNYPVSGPTTS